MIFSAGYNLARVFCKLFNASVLQRCQYKLLQVGPAEGNAPINKCHWVSSLITQNGGDVGRLNNSVLNSSSPLLKGNNHENGLYIEVSCGSVRACDPPLL